MPYILSAAAKANESGIPILRTMFLEFPEDPVSWKLDLQVRILHFL